MSSMAKSRSFFKHGKALSFIKYERGKRYKLRVYLIEFICK
jgi:hypothetical protein